LKYIKDEERGRSGEHFHLPHIIHHIPLIYTAACRVPADDIFTLTQNYPFLPRQKKQSGIYTAVWSNFSIIMQFSRHCLVRLETGVFEKY